MKFGEILKTLRTKKGLTLDEVAKKIGVSNATVSRWETGEIKNIGSDKIGALADVLGTSTEYLLGRSTNPTATETNNPVPIYMDDEYIISTQTPEIAVSQRYREKAAEKILAAIEDIFSDSSDYVKAPSGAKISIIKPECVDIVIDFLTRNSDLLKAQFAAKKSK